MFIRFGRSSFNGVQYLLFNHGFRQLRLYSTSISTEVSSKFVNYLVENLGFSKQQAISTCSKYTRRRQIRDSKRFNSAKFVTNANSVIRFLEEVGLEKSDIRNVVVIEPQILMSHVQKTLTPKIEIFEKSGFSKPVIADFVGVNPSLLFMTWNTSSIDRIQALRDIMDLEDNVISLLKKLRFIHHGAISRHLVPNVALLRTYGIPINLIQRSIIREPLAFFRKTEHFKDALIRAEKTWGIVRTSPRFMSCVIVLSSTNAKTIETKKQVYKSFGWSDSDVISLVMLCPSLLALSEDTIKKKLDFLMNELGYEPSELASKCSLFTCSLEKRVVCRHKVLAVLKEKGFIRKDYALDTAVVYPEPTFVKRFVLPFKEVHEVYSKHAGISLEMLTLGSSNPSSSVV